MKQQNPIEKTILPNIKNMIMIVSGKGGVGKSTVAAGIAISLAEEGYSVGLLDADIFGPSVPTLVNLQDVERPLMVEKDGRQVMEPFERFGIKIMSIGFFFDSDQAVIWRGPMVSNMLKQLKRPFGVIVNRAGLGNKEVYDWLKANKIPLLMEIPFDREIARIYSEGHLLVEEKPEYQHQFIELLKTIEKLVKR